MFRLDDDETNKKREFEKMFGTGGEEKIHGASFPASIWHDYMAGAMKGKKAIAFPEPQDPGEVVWGGGAVSPSPTPSPTPSEEPSEEPTPTPTPTQTTPSPTPTPTKTCGIFDPNCQAADGGANAGADGGGQNGGADGGGDNTGADGGGDNTGTTDGGDNNGGAQGANGNPGGTGSIWGNSG